MISHAVHVDSSASSVMLLMGMAVGVDYSLFYLRREREERNAGRDRAAALRIAAATSGRSVLVSGLTVMVAMAGMFLTGTQIFDGFAIATVSVVLIAMAGSVTVLPALLSLPGDKVELGRVPCIGRMHRTAGDSRFWKAASGPSPKPGPNGLLLQGHRPGAPECAQMARTLVPAHPARGPWRADQAGRNRKTMNGDAAEVAPDLDLARHARFLITTAARAPSVHNTQPWQFRIGPEAVELWCDPGRKLKTDPAGREMLISCGAALFGLRLAIRSLGYLPVTELLPDPARLRLLAWVRPGRAVPAGAGERRLLEAVPHRHTHRGPFTPGPVPAGLLAGLQHDALSEGATLTFVDGGLAYQRLAGLVADAARRGDLDPRARAEIRRWTRVRASTARDGVPALAFTGQVGPGAGVLAQRDFDLGRGLGQLLAGGESPPVTAVLLTARDVRADWLRAGQALQRLLLHAATRWVFASLHTQPLENATTRGLIQDQLGLPGRPQILMQLGCAATTPATARRGPEEIAGP